VEHIYIDGEDFGFLHNGEDENESNCASLSSKEEEDESDGEEETSSVEVDATLHTTNSSGGGTQM